jgi:hypothetical protein
MFQALAIAGVFLIIGVTTDIMYVNFNVSSNISFLAKGIKDKISQDVVV